MLNRTPFCFAFAALAVIAAQPAASEETSLKEAAAKALAFEKSTALPITSFYDDPASLAGTKPGELIRQEAFTGYKLPEGASAVRILYHSTGAKGEDVATSGVVLIPPGQAPAGGWPVIAWAHGTAGINRNCAPSAMTDVYYGNDGLFKILANGFAIVASDYRGLGTKGPHLYMDKAAQASDVVYSVPAARAAVPALGRQWITLGHSQGGAAVWGVTEKQAGLKDETYLGAVAVSGSQLKTMMLNSQQHKVGAYLIPFVAHTIKAEYPEFKPTDLLSDTGAAHYEEITTGEGCYSYANAMYRGTSIGEMLRPGWDQNEWASKFLAQNASGDKPLKGPVLAIVSEDEVVRLEDFKATVDRACKQGAAVTFRAFPKLNHLQAMTETIDIQVAWMKDRFAGKPEAGNCSK